MATEAAALCPNGPARGSCALRNVKPEKVGKGVDANGFDQIVVESGSCRGFGYAAVRPSRQRQDGSGSCPRLCTDAPTDFDSVDVRETDIQHDGLRAQFRRNSERLPARSRNEGLVAPCAEQDGEGLGGVLIVVHTEDAFCRCHSCSNCFFPNLPRHDPCQHPEILVISISFHCRGGRARVPDPGEPQATVSTWQPIFESAQILLGASIG